MVRLCVPWMYFSPKIGEIIGGSERESDYNKLMTRIEENAYSDEGYVVVSGYS